MAPARARLLACLLPALTMMAAAVSWVAAGGGRMTDGDTDRVQLLHVQ